MKTDTKSGKRARFIITRFYLVTYVFCLLFLCSEPSALSQIPQGFNYQALALDASGMPVKNATIKVKLSILSDTAGFYSGTGGTYIWEEEHTGISTNSSGIFSIVLGSPTATKIQGSAASFSDINWSAANLYIGTKIASPTTYKVMGAAKLWSVPYAMRSNTSASEKWLQSGSNIYYNSGKVGIWTSNPQTALTVTENLSSGITYPLYLQNASDDWTASEKGVGLRFGRMSPTSGHDYGSIRGTTASTNGSQGRLQLTGGPGNDPHVTIDYTGKVGIGTANPASKVVIQPPSDWDDNTPLFEVKNKIGVPVLAVYNNGVKILVEDTDGKGSKGGFAIGGFDPTKGTGDETVNLMTVTTDSVRINIDNSTKAVKGGFAIGGFDRSKGFANYLNITPDSTRIFTGDPLKGFGIGNISSGAVENYLKLTPSNYFIGHEAGTKITTGLYNSVLGYRAGANLTSGPSNVFIGHQSGQNATTGDASIFIGAFAGNSVTTGQRSVLIGAFAGQYWETGEGNTYIGYAAGQGLGSGMCLGTNNTYIGEHAGQRMRWGDHNVYIGDRSGVECRKGMRNVLIGGLVNYNYDGFLRNDTLNENVIIGYNAAGSNYHGDKNVIIGALANGEHTTGGFNGSSNVFIGYMAGYKEKSSNKLYIDNSGTTSPLIYGDFTDGSEKLVINGNLGIGVSPGTRLSVSGLTGSASGSTLVISGNNVYYLTSKRSSKENIVPLQDDFNKILLANPVAFKDRTTGNPGIGYIAEDFEDAGLHNLLVYENGELVSLRYDLISVYNLEIIKKQQKLLEEQQKENEQMRSELESLKERLSALEAVVGSK